jgi:hypothetical protein
VKPIAPNKTTKLLNLQNIIQKSSIPSAKPQFIYQQFLHTYKTKLATLATMYRSAILRQTRYLSTSTRFQKSAVDVGKDAVKKVDRVVSDTLVGAIETGGKSSLFHVPSTGCIEGVKS